MSENTEIISSQALIRELRRSGMRLYWSYDTDNALNEIKADWDYFENTQHDDVVRMWSALTAEYKPLDNYNMVESGSTTDSNKHTATYTKESTTTDTGTSSYITANTRTLDTTNTLTHTGTNTTEDKSTITVADTGTQTTSTNNTTDNSVSAYDSAAYTPTDKSAITGNDTRTDNLTSTTTNGGQVDVKYNTTDTTSDEGTVKDSGSDDYTRNLASHIKGEDTDKIIDEGTETHTLTRSGNIGVTTSQQMLTSEIYLRARNNLVHYVVALFLSDFTTW